MLCDLLGQDNINKGIVMTRKGSLNIRNQADAHSIIIGQISKGDTVTVLKDSLDWYKVKFYDTQTGYCKGIYIDLRRPEDKHMQRAYKHFYFDDTTQWHYWYEDWLVLIGDNQNHSLINKKIRISKVYYDYHYDMSYSFDDAKDNRNYFIFKDISYLHEGPVELVFQRSPYMQSNDKAENRFDLSNGNSFILKYIVNEIKAGNSKKYEGRVVFTFGELSQILVNKACGSYDLLKLAGDLDGDGMLDIIIDTMSPYQNEYPYSLFLSTASSDSLLKEVAKFSIIDYY